MCNIYAFRDWLEQNKGLEVADINMRISTGSAASKFVTEHLKILSKNVFITVNHKHLTKFQYIKYCFNTAYFQYVIEKQWYKRVLDNPTLANTKSFVESMLLAKILKSILIKELGR